MYVYPKPTKTELFMCRMKHTSESKKLIYTIIRLYSHVGSQQGENPFRCPQK